MTVTKFTYEQFCTHIDGNVIFEEIFFEDGSKKIVCTNNDCIYNGENCKNKIRQNN